MDVHYLLTPQYIIYNLPSLLSLGFFLSFKNIGGTQS